MGSTLIEILVSIVVLSMGLLGLVGLQVAALRNAREAKLQSTGVWLATELAERMRGNPLVATRHDGPSNPYLQPLLRAAPSGTTADCVTASCATPEQVAAWDIGEWSKRVFATDGGLPDARVTVCFDEQPFDDDGLPVWRCTGTGDVVQVKLGWRRASTNRSRTGSAAFERVDDADSRPAISIPVMAGAPA